MLVSKATVNKHTLTSTLTTIQIEFALTYLLTSVATDLDLRHK